MSPCAEGREGSQNALVGWGVIAAGEALFLIASMIQGEFLVSTLVLGGALAIQSVMYSDARKKEANRRFQTPPGAGSQRPTRSISATLSIISRESSRSPQEQDHGFDLRHLEKHRTEALPVSVEVEERNGQKAARRIDDA